MNPTTTTTTTATTTPVLLMSTSSSSTPSTPSMPSLSSSSDDETQRQQQQQHPQQGSPPPPSPSTTTANRSQWKDAVAGACAGAFSRTVMAPIERIKLLKQLQGSVPTLTTTTSSWQIARNVYVEQGLRSFWRGNFSNVLRVSGGAAINFTCMDYYKNVAVLPWLEQNVFLQRQQTHGTQQRNERKRKFISSFVSGGLTGATTTTLLYPIEFVRTRLAMDLGGKVHQREFTGTWDVMSTILRKDGIAGLYQGYGIALAGGIFYRILLFGGYDALKGEMLFRKQVIATTTTNTNNSNTHNNNSMKLSWMERIVSAQIISLVAGTLSYPFDSVRRRMMMQAGKSQRQYTTSFHCISTIFHQEGIRGFYLGLGPNIVRSVGGAILLVGYDSVRNML